MALSRLGWGFFGGGLRIETKSAYRMNLERQYRSLMKDDMDAGSDFVYNKGKETVKDVLAVVGSLAYATITPITAYKVKRALDKKE